MHHDIDAKLTEMGLTLPTPATPAGSYVPAVRSGNLVFVSGQIPMGPDGVRHVGRLGEGVTIEEGQAAAKLCALNILAHVKGAAGSFDKVVRIVKVNGYVNSSADFTDQPKVVNGASDLFVALFGDAGRHARAAIGVANLPMGVAVEVEAVVEIAP